MIIEKLKQVLRLSHGYDTKRETREDIVAISRAVEELQRTVNQIIEKIEKWYRDWETDRKSTRLNSSHSAKSRMPSSA